MSTHHQRLAKAHTGAIVAREGEVMSRPDVYADIRAERERQDAKHGGPEHDDTHTVWEWKHFRELWEHRVTDMLASRHEGVYEPEDARIALVQIAALAVAQIEALGRKHRRGVSSNG